MGFFSRTIGMGLAGGAMGYMNTGDLGGIAGGAAAGAGFGAIGMPVASRFLAQRGGLAGMARGGMRGLGGLAKMGERGTFNMAARNMGNRLGVAAGYGTDAFRTARMGLAGARGFMGRNAINVNRYGGAGLAALGLGASAHIGSSVIGSNRGY